MAQDNILSLGDDRRATVTAFHNWSETKSLSSYLQIVSVNLASFRSFAAHQLYGYFLELNHLVMFTDHAGGKLRER